MIENKVKELSDLLVSKSIKEAECFPVDRYFLDPYIKNILSLNKKDFIVYNLENVNNTYTVQLFVCIPELWLDIDENDLIEIIENFTNIFSYYGLIIFTYRYIEINIIDLILDLPTVSLDTKENIKQFLKSQYPNLMKSETDYLFFEEGLLGVQIEDWKYIKQRLLLAKKITPSVESLIELKEYVSIV